MPTIRRALLPTAVCLLALAAAFLFTCASRPVQAQETPPADGPVVHILYFYSLDCPHCRAVEEELLQPLQAQYDGQIDLRMFEVSDPANYELLIRVEEYFDIAPEERGLPTLVIAGQVLIGEEQIRQQLPCLIDSCLLAGGTAWPPIPGLEAALTPGPTTPLTQTLGPAFPIAGSPAACVTETVSACPTNAPIWAAYFYQVGCQECSRAEYDIEYIRSRYPQLIVEEFNIYDDLPLARWLARRVGREAEIHAPALFIGDDALVGEGEITPQNLEALLTEYLPTGAPQVWRDFDPSEASVLERLPGVLTVVLAGLVDGLNPCAFATLVFLIAYLAAGERKGRDVLLVGGLFTLGVFLAYLAVGLGFYRVLDLLGSLLTTLGRWVYALTALFCAVLAVLSFLDFLKARRGQIEEMTLTLPAAIRRRVRAVIRQGQKARAYFVAAFVTGLVISLLELACTGQIYLPTIIYIASQPALRALGVGYLLLYNLFFIAPLVVVFALTYFGTTSFQLGQFLQRRTAAVKLGTAIVFLALALWLGISLLG